ncbi:MAG: hypothetical protein PX636_09945 [Microcystis sp. M53598_WE2]|nr:hypothetical protein [Microcystis sp. M53600_WE12]MDJ0671292.1 hypothetical protein [Microcystis sp. M53598_WE2]
MLLGSGVRSRSSGDRRLFYLFFPLPHTPHPTPHTPHPTPYTLPPRKTFSADPK